MKYTTTNPDIQKTLQNAGVTNYTYDKDVLGLYSITIWYEGKDAVQIDKLVRNFLISKGKSPVTMPAKNQANFLIQFLDEKDLNEFNLWFYQMIQQPDKDKYTKKYLEETPEYTITDIKIQKALKDAGITKHTYTYDFDTQKYIIKVRYEGDLKDQANDILDSCTLAAFKSGKVESPNVSWEYEAKTISFTLSTDYKETMENFNSLFYKEVQKLQDISADKIYFKSPVFTSF